MELDMNISIDEIEDSLTHHGIEGQKWGIQNGPPYPLSNEVSTGSRLKEGSGEKKKKDSSGGETKKLTWKEKMAVRKEERAAKKAEKKAEKEKKEQEKFEKSKKKAIEEGDTLWAKENAYKLSNQEISDILNRRNKIDELDSSLSPTVAYGVAKMQKLNKVMRVTTDTIMTINNFNRARNDFKDLTEDKSQVSKVTEYNSTTDKTKGTRTSVEVGINNGIRYRNTVITNVDGSKNRTHVEEKENKAGNSETKTKEKTSSETSKNDSYTKKLEQRNKDLENAIHASYQKSQNSQKGSISDELGYNKDGSRKAVDGSVVAKYKEEEKKGPKYISLKHSVMEALVDDIDDSLMHHGIDGQKWGVDNGPPYPLDPEDHSAAEKRAGLKENVKKAGRSFKTEKDKKMEKLLKEQDRQDSKKAKELGIPVEFYKAMAKVTMEDARIKGLPTGNYFELQEYREKHNK